MRLVKCSNKLKTRQIQSIHYKVGLIYVYSEASVLLSQVNLKRMSFVCIAGKLMCIPKYWRPLKFFTFTFIYQYRCTKGTFLQEYLEILKCLLQNVQEILSH